MNFSSVVSDGATQKVSYSDHAEFEMSTSASDPWRVQLRHAIALNAGKRYSVCFDAWADSARSITVNIHAAGTPNNDSIIGGGESITLSPSKNAYHRIYDASVTDNTARLTLSVGNDSTDVFFDNIGVYEGELCGDAASGAKPSSGSSSSSSSSGAVGSVGSAGCDVANQYSNGSRKFSVSGKQREIIIRRPNGYKAKTPAPLVIAMHPNNNPITYWQSSNASRDIAKKMGDEAIIVHAGASDRVWWKRGDPPAHEAEVAYIDRAIRDLKNNLCVDTSRIYAFGFSGGGSFAGVLACRRTDIRAMASTGGRIYFDEKKCVGGPVPALISYGKNEIDDGRVAYRDWMRNEAGCSNDKSQVPGQSACVSHNGCDVPFQFCTSDLGHVVPPYFLDASWSFFKKFSSNAN